VRGRFALPAVRAAMEAQRARAEAKQRGELPPSAV